MVSSSGYRTLSMPLILPLVEAVAHLPARGALIGLDLGTKTIGVASSDPDRKLATGVETIARKTFWYLSFNRPRPPSPKNPCTTRENRAEISLIVSTLIP